MKITNSSKTEFLRKLANMQNISLNKTSGKVGDLVTISGGTFGHSQYRNGVRISTVTFHGVQAHGVSWVNDRIIVMVPVGATTGQVIVTIDGEQFREAEFIVTS